MRTGKVGETCSAFNRGSTARRKETLRTSAAEFFPEAALRRIAESSEGDVLAHRCSDRPVKATVRPRRDSGEESSRLQHLDRSVREAAAILYVVIILGMVAAGFLVAFLLW